MSVNLKLFRY